MRIESGSPVLSPSDLMRFRACQHASALDLRLLRGKPLVEADESPDAVVLQRRGMEHERRFLHQLEETRDVVEIARADDFAETAAATRAAMAAGAPAIYQGALASGRWQGYADFLERVDRPSALGGFGYEVVDTKLKRSAEPQHAIQLAIYSRAVGEVQGCLPQDAHVQLGDGTRASIRLAGVQNYVARLAARLEAFVDAPTPTRPEPVAACSLCRWREVCGSQWESSDSLIRVAGITRSQRRKLEAGGIGTRSALASAPDTVPRLDLEAFRRLRTQARLQVERQAGGGPSFVLREALPGRGFARLPRPDAGDLFFDMEGDPFVEGGLEYLFGIVHEVDGCTTFRSWWAHDPTQERAALSSVLDFLVDHLGRHPGAHVYHYNHYEVTALRRLTMRDGVGEEKLDHLLRTEAFVDLYRIVNQAIITSEAGQSLKDLEAFYAMPRQGQVATAAASVVAYEAWLDDRDPSILASIASYNEEDCRSTRLLRDWLVANVRPPGAEWRVPVRAEPAAPIEDPDLMALRDRVQGASARLPDGTVDLLLELNGFHARAARPQWWEYFDRQVRDHDELLEDLETLVDLQALAPPRGQERAYSYPEQETKMRTGAKVAVLGFAGSATIVAMDRKARSIGVKFPRKAGTPPEACDLVPDKPIFDRVLRDAVRRVTDALTSGSGRYRAIEDFLARHRPRLSGHCDGAPLAEAVDAIGRLDAGCLPIQGPPGTGKTYVASCAILALARRGRRVAVSSNSHKAIDNLLVAVADRAREAGLHIPIVKKAKGQGGEEPDDPMIELSDDHADAALDQALVVGGTAWLFARPERDATFDTLVIDEAGQVSIANVVACATCARNIVLVGDQMQLPQPLQGVHPGESGLSSLEYLLRGQQAVASSDGIFLPVSRRMHRDVCRVVSTLFYDGRLTSGAGADGHAILFDEDLGLPATGVFRLEVEHAASNSQSSAEEAERVRRIFDALLRGRFRDRHGTMRRMRLTDILVVSPYNAQVNLLSDVLPVGARVGTIDKYQGQEAPVCLVSMATAGEEELPRDIEFLFSPHRLNVAISRAQALAIVVCSTRLLDVRCRTIGELRRVNALSSIASLATAD